MLATNHRALLTVLIATAFMTSGCITTVSELKHEPLQIKTASVPPKTDTSITRTQLEAVALPPESSPAITLPPLNSSPSKTLEDLIGLALAQNPMVQAARLNVESLGHRIVQARSLDDPVISNSIYPIPSVAPQYSLMGYMPYDFLIAQQFPWSGTLRRRGMVAEKDVRIALEELSATELDTVADLKKSYADLQFIKRASAILDQNKQLAKDFLTLAQERYRTGTAAQSDVMRAEISLSEIEREHATLSGESESALAELARILGEPASADHLMSIQINDLHTDKDEPPAALEQLYEIAVQARPDLSGRLAAIERDQIAEELAALRGKPNVSLGFIYQSMQKTNAIQPQTAMGVPNIGLFVGFNLPVYRAKIAAGVAEAQARTAADRALYEAEKNQSRRDIRTLHNSVKVQRQVLKLIQDTNLPNTRRILESVESDYRSGKAGVDVLSMLSAWRDVLAVELQIAQVETELAKSSASLERAVGMRLTQISPEELKSIKPSLPGQLPTLPPMSVTP
jgi:outer membrane protein TolC